MLAILFGIIAGLALGLTGSGGSIFAVPMLVYGLHLSVSEAVAVSLLAVCAIASAGAVRGVLARVVEMRTGVVFAVTGMLGAPLGIRLGHQLDDSLRLGAFALLMLIVGVLMWRKARSEEAAVLRAEVFARPTGDDAGPVCRYTPEGALRLTAPCMLVLVVSGFATGVLAGLFGVGGGFLIVPALRLTTGLSMRRTVATSLMVIALVSASGAVSFFAGGGAAPWTAAGLFIGGGLCGLLAGAFLAARLASATLQRIFAVFIVFTGAAMLVRESFLT